MEDCAIQFDEGIRIAALNALNALWMQYFSVPEKETWKLDLIRRYTEGTKSEKETHSLGYVAALGCFPKQMVTGKFDVVLESLIRATRIAPSTVKWAPGRKEALNSIVKLCKTVGFSTDGRGK